MIELTSDEQQVLDQCGVELQMAQARLQQTQQQLEQARAKTEMAAGKLSGACEAILRLRGQNPHAYQATWENESVVLSLINQPAKETQ